MEISKCWQDVKKLESLYTTSGNRKWYSHYGKVWWFLKKPSIKLPYDPEILLLGIYTEELKAGTQTDTSTPVLVALFTIAKR